MGWITVGMTIFITNISSEHLLGLTGAAAQKGLSVIQFEWLAIFFIILLGWVFAPVFLKNGVLTVPEYFGKRFDSKSRTYLSLISIFTYLLTKIGVSLLVINYFLKSYFGLQVTEITLIIILLTGLYTVVGGMYSVVYTQIFQTIVLLISIFALSYFSISEVGGISALTTKLDPDYFSLFKSVNDPDIPWSGILFGAPILALWYWCTDQYIVQRILCSENIKTIKKASLLTSLLKSFPILLLVVPGLAVIAINPSINTNEVFAFLLSGKILPDGIKGLVIAGLFAALMSSLAAAFHSSATIFTLDLYKPRHPEISERKQVLIGRLASTALVIIAIALMPLMKMVESNIYIFLQGLQAFISPPIAAVFLLSVFWKKATARGAYTSLIIGGGIGIIRILMELIEFRQGFISAVLNINYLHFAAILFLISAVICIAVSLAWVENESDVTERHIKIVNNNRIN